MIELSFVVLLAGKIVAVGALPRTFATEPICMQAAHALIGAVKGDAFLMTRCQQKTTRPT
jgi:hypothetical protein